MLCNFHYTFFITIINFKCVPDCRKVLIFERYIVSGLTAGAVHVIEPHPRPELSGLGISLNGELPADPAVLVIAVKPQMMADVLPRLSVGSDTLVVSVAAGVTIAAYEAALQEEQLQPPQQDQQAEPAQ